MKFPRLRTLLLAPLVLFALLYLAGTVTLALTQETVEPEAEPVRLDTIAIFGASGTAGDGILKAALAEPGIRRIHVITRRPTPRIEEGVAAGRVQMTLHTDYLDYATVHVQVAQADAVYWAIGTSSAGLDEESYRRIHSDFPARFVGEWLAVSERPALSFHYISSSDISEDSKWMWAREKLRAERTLAALAEGTKLRTVFYRPDYIGPTAEEARLGQKLLYWFFAPVGAAVQATQIGQAMIEATARADEFGHGAILGTRRIIRYADAYEGRPGGDSAGSAD